MKLEWIFHLGIPGFAVLWIGAKFFFEDLINPTITLCRLSAYWMPEFLSDPLCGKQRTGENHFSRTSPFG